MRRQFRNPQSLKDLEMILLFLFLVISMFLVGSIGHAQTKSEVESTIREIATQYGADPDLAVAIAEVESGLNPKVVGKLGEIGVFQLRPDFHAVKPGNDRKNIEIAIRYMNQLKRDCAVYGEYWFICWNLGPNYKRLKFPEKFVYAKKVRRALAGGE